RSREAAGGSVTLTPKIPWSSSGMKPAGGALPKKPAPAATPATVTMGNIERRPSRGQPATKALVGRPKGFVEQPSNISQGAPRWFRWPQEHGAQRGGKRESTKSREQHRDGDGKSELLVHASGQPTQEGHRNEHGREDERDADDWGRHLLHGLDRGFLG